MVPLITFLPCTTLLITLGQGRTWISAFIVNLCMCLLRQKIQLGWCLTVHFIFCYERQRCCQPVFSRFDSVVSARLSFRGTANSAVCWPVSVLGVGSVLDDRSGHHGGDQNHSRSEDTGAVSFEWADSDIINDGQKSFFGAALFNVSVQSCLGYWKESARIFLGVSNHGNGLVHL